MDRRNARDLIRIDYSPSGSTLETEFPGGVGPGLTHSVGLLLVHAASTGLAARSRPTGCRVRSLDRPSPARDRSRSAARASRFEIELDPPARERRARKRHLEDVVAAEHPSDLEARSSAERAFPADLSSLRFPPDDPDPEAGGQRIAPDAEIPGPMTFPFRATSRASIACGSGSTGWMTTLRSKLVVGQGDDVEGLGRDVIPVGTPRTRRSSLGRGR